MTKTLLTCIAALICCNLLRAQDVFSPSDAIVTYNSLAPAGSSTNPNMPGPGIMSKWVRTPRMSWTTTNFKCYFWNGMAFRLRFPNNYNPANASKYPVMVFFHGGGEIGTVYDNEYQLYWGASLFEQRINNGEWNGFMLFPQETSVGWDDNYFSRINGVLDTLQKYNNADPDRVISMGLSSGGYGAVAYAYYYPQRVAVSLPASPASVRTLSGGIPGFVHVPIWLANGGIDVNPDPYSVQGFCSDFRNAGGNIYQTYFVNDSHGTWTDMWNQKNAGGAFITTTYWNNAHKAQPLLYFQNNQFCDAGPIAAKMGITAGFYAYQWQLNGSTIPGANGNEYTATQAGQYRARFMRTATSSWSDWSPNPIVIGTKTCATDTLFAEHFDQDNFFVSEPEYSIGNFPCQDGIMTTGTDVLTQDATGVQGDRFLIDFTKAGSGCTFTANDRIWKTYSAVTVQPNTNYEYSFYIANQNATSPALLAPTINGTQLTTGSASATGVGNSSWKKFTYTWNSGPFTYADLGIINRSIVTTGNDFAIDEITFKLAPALPVPGCTSNSSPANGATLSTNSTATLTWTAAANAAAYDVYLWKGTTAATTPIATVTGTSYSASGLTGSSTYYWYVVPKNSNAVAATGCSNNQTSFTTAVTPVAPNCTVNTAPVSNATLSTNNTASLAWTAVSTATSYDVYLWSGTTAPASPTANVSSNAYSASGLTSSTKYNWYVVPKNAVGAASGCQASATAFTTAAGPSVPSCTTNTSPANATTVSSTSSATLTWNAAATAVSYDLYIWSGASVPASPAVNVSSTSYTVTGLTPGTTYNWYVAPRNAAGPAIGCVTAKTSFNTAAGPVVGTGTGLKGDYYNTINLSGYIYMSRTDATVDFNWGTGSPYYAIDPNSFSVRWTGQVQAQYTQTYTFYVTSDDGARLWVNGQLLTNNWTDHNPVTNSGTISLVAGVRYDIRLEYYENTGNTRIQLAWSSASTPTQVIPKSQLYVPGAPARIASTEATGLRVGSTAASANGMAESADRSVASPASADALLQPGLFPNPVRRGQPATLRLNSRTGGTAQLQILNAAGAVIQVQQLLLGAGTNSKTISTSSLAPGMYIIRVTGSIDEALALKLLVQ